MTLLFALLLAAHSSFAQTPELRVLSYNVAGVPIVHPKIGKRMIKIGERLSRGEGDVVALQEVWREADAERLAKASGLPHRARSKQRWHIGDGLMILSRFPIREWKALRFSERTRRWLAFDGEQIAHKGALLARVAAPGGELDVYDVHFVADYVNYSNAEVRRAQTLELARWVRRESEGRPVILTGDLNMTTDDPTFTQLTALLGLSDACNVRGEDACASPSRKRRIDFILVSRGAAPAPRIEVLSDEGLEVGGGRIPLSDHLAVLAHLASNPAPLPPRSDPEVSAALLAVFGAAQ